MDKKLYELELVNFVCSFQDELKFGVGRYINAETYEGVERVFYAPCEHHEKLISEFNNYKYQIEDILAKGVKPEDLAYLLKLDVKLFLIYYDYTVSMYDHEDCYKDIDSVGSAEIQFYFDCDEEKYKKLRLF
jgi:hypothetical protein